MAKNIEKNDILSTTKEEITDKSPPTICAPWEYQIIYIRVMFFVYWHCAAAYGLYLSIATAAWTTLAFNYILYVATQIGVTAGAHRLWSHRSYKATPGLQVLLMLFQSLASQSTVNYWAWEHRMHHKYSDTDADPHNSTRGFFFSHFGWMFVRKHTELKRLCKGNDVSDLHRNPILMFQEKYEVPLITTAAFILPTIIPACLWGESFTNAYHVNILRVVVNLNVTFLINSAAHMWGNKPYDRNLKATQNIAVSIGTLGEGFHNYHHAFPWDYRAAELRHDYLNLSTRFIDLCARLGCAYDLRAAPAHLVAARADRTGDGSYSPTRITYGDDMASLDKFAE